MKTHLRSLRPPVERRHPDRPDRRRPGRLVRHRGENAFDPKWLSLLMDMPFIAVAVMDAQSRAWVRVNDRFCALLGYTRAELAHLDWRQICHPADRAACSGMLRRIDKPIGGHERMSHRLVRKDGTVVSVEIDLCKGDPRGRTGEFIVALLHEQVVPAESGAIGDRRLFVQEEVAFALIEQSIFGIYVVDEGVFSFANARMAQIFGYEPDEIQGKAVVDLVAEEDRARVAENLRKRVSGEVGSLKYEFHGLRKDGSIVVVGVHGAAAKLGGRAVVVGVIQDISEKVRADEAIQRYVRALEDAMQSTVQVVSVIGELRDPYTHGHERRVGELAAAIAGEMQLDANRIEGIRVAGYLHDVGKIGIPAELLSKPTRLSHTEFELVKGHAWQSFEILKGVNFPWPVALAAQQHHERLDGTGYPTGLKGDAILQDARILAVADVMEAISSHRPYRPALGVDRGLEEVRRGRGTAYDPDAAEACERAFAKGYALTD